MKKDTRHFALRREIIRALADTELTLAVGGLCTQVTNLGSSCTPMHASGEPPPRTK